MLCEQCGKRDAQTTYNRMYKPYDLEIVAVCYTCKAKAISEEILDLLIKIEALDADDIVSKKHLSNHIAYLAKEEL